MTWGITNENLVEYLFASEFVQGTVTSTIAFWVLIANRKGPNWIKGFIFSIFLSYLFLTIKAVLRIELIGRKPEKSEQTKLLKYTSFSMSYIHRQIYFITMILFTLFYWVNAKYNEHVIECGTVNSESSHKERVAFTRRYSKITMVYCIFVFIGITIMLILIATVP